MSGKTWRCKICGEDVPLSLRIDNHSCKPRSADLHRELEEAKAEAVRRDKVFEAMRARIDELKQRVEGDS